MGLNEFFLIRIFFIYALLQTRITLYNTTTVFLERLTKNKSYSEMLLQCSMFLVQSLVFQA